MYFHLRNTYLGSIIKYVFPIVKRWNKLSIRYFGK